MKTTVISASLLVVLLSFSGVVFAIDLNTAKQQGLVGEMSTGYLGSPSGKPSPEVKALINDINSKRKSRFSDVAKKQGIKVEDVAKIFAEKAATKTKAGHYIQKSNGQWIKR